MANTISFDSSSTYDGRKMIVSGIQTVNNNGTSSIVITLTTSGGNSNNYSTGPTTLTVTYVKPSCVWRTPVYPTDYQIEETLFYKNRIGYGTSIFPVTKGSMSFNFVTGSDVNGVSNITIKLSTAIYYGSAQVKEDTRTWVLDSVGFSYMIPDPDFVQEPSTEIFNPYFDQQPAANLLGCYIEQISKIKLVSGSFKYNKNNFRNQTNGAEPTQTKICIIGIAKGYTQRLSDDVLFTNSGDNIISPQIISYNFNFPVPDAYVDFAVGVRITDSHGQTKDYYRINDGTNVDNIRYNKKPDLPQLLNLRYGRTSVTTASAPPKPFPFSVSGINVGVIIDAFLSSSVYNNKKQSVFIGVKEVSIEYIGTPETGQINEIMEYESGQWGEVTNPSENGMTRGILVIQNLNLSKTYKIKITIKDNLNQENTENSYVRIIDPAKTPLNITKNGICIGGFYGTQDTSSGITPLQMKVKNDIDCYRIANLSAFVEKINSDIDTNKSQVQLDFTNGLRVIWGYVRATNGTNPITIQIDTSANLGQNGDAYLISADANYVIEDLIDCYIESIDGLSSDPSLYPLNKIIGWNDEIQIQLNIYVYRENPTESFLFYKVVVLIRADNTGGGG